MSVAVLTLTWRGMVGAMLPMLTGRVWVGYAVGLLLRPTAAPHWLQLAMLAALLPPLGRIPVASLALECNRHR